MFLGVYHFDGEADDLLARYDALMADFPPDAILLHACVVRDGGISVYDACPSAEVFAAFSTGPDFAAAVAAVGLPVPRVDHLGQVHSARIKG
jgi:hypothetical protein